MSQNVVRVNRAPVLTLWAAVVAERQGYDWETALTLGKAVAGLNAQAKARHLGIVGPAKAPEGGGSPRGVGLGEDCWVEVCGRPVPAKHTEAGLRAVVKDQCIDPAAVQRYLQSKFGEEFGAVLEAMRELAGTYAVEELAGCAYGLYERFRPQIPAGKRGWGQAGELDLGRVRGLGRKE